MNCPKCDYLLFNLTKPVCPECGQGFYIEWFRFQLGSVSFRCPHCDQQYYGNDANGLPMPRQFSCTECSQSISLQEMRVVPERADARGMPAWGSPWDDRKRLGTIRAWWKTLIMTMIRPGDFFRLHSGKTTYEAWLFATISMYACMVPYMLFQVLLMWGMTAAITAAGSGGGVPMPLGWFAVMYGVIAIVGPPLGSLIYAGVSTVCIHMALAALAPHRKSMSHTFRTVLYALGPYALVAVPLCGSTVGGIWSLVTLIIGVKEVHQVSGWRASVAVLWPVVLLIMLYLAAIGVFLSGSFYAIP